MPNLFKRLFTKSLAVNGTVFLNGFDNQADVNNLSSYKESLYLYIGVSMIAKRVAGIPLELYKIKNKAGNVDEVFAHQLLDLFYNPNEMQTQREFFELSTSYYLLSGDCFWYLDRNGSKIDQLIALRPDLVEIQLSADQKRIVAYKYRNGGEVTFRPEDVIHIKNTDPSNALRGVGVVRPATTRILTEREAAKYQANFFQNQGRPDIAIVSEDIHNKEQADDARREWRRIFGSGNSGQTAFFGGGVKLIQELNKTPKEMDFIETQKFLRGDILAALHIPEAMVNSGNVNKTDSQEAYKMYLQEAVVPVLEAFIDVINNKLIPQVDQSVFIDFADPTPDDRELMLKEVTGLKRDGIITANEARARYEYEALEGADVLATASTRPEVAEVAKAMLRRRPGLVKRFVAKEEMAALIQLNEPKRQMNSIFPTKAMKDLYAKAYNAKVDKKADEVKATLDQAHEAMLERILATDLNINGFMDVQAEKRLMKDAMKPIMVKVYQEGGQAALDAIFKKSADQFFSDAILLAAVEGRVAFFADSIVDTTFEVLKGKIVSGLAAGDGPDKIAASFRDYFTDMSVKRAKTIARTETGFVLSKATNDAYTQSSVVTGKEWLTVGDSNVRPEHVENDGAIVAKGGAFPNGEEYPAQHSINCRCVLLPTI